jgi:muconolactone delta-isomerase
MSKEAGVKGSGDSGQWTVTSGQGSGVGCRYNLFMQFLSMSRRRTDAFPPEAFTPELLAQEGKHVKKLQADGILQQIWLRDDIPGAAILWEAATEADVRAAIGSLPIFQAGMLEIVVLAPLKPYPGF